MPPRNQSWRCEIPQNVLAYFYVRIRDGAPDAGGRCAESSGRLRAGHLCADGSVGRSGCRRGGKENGAAGCQSSQPERLPAGGRRAHVTAERLRRCMAGERPEPPGVLCSQPRDRGGGIRQGEAGTDWTAAKFKWGLAGGLCAEVADGARYPVGRRRSPSRSGEQW